MNNQKKQYYNLQKEQQKFCNFTQMVEYGKINIKLSNTRLKKQKTAVKDKTGKTLRIN